MISYVKRMSFLIVQTVPVTLPPSPSPISESNPQLPAQGCTQHRLWIPPPPTEVPFFHCENPSTKACTLRDARTYLTMITQTTVFCSFCRGNNIRDVLSCFFQTKFLHDKLRQSQPLHARSRTYSSNLACQ